MINHYFVKFNSGSNSGSNLPTAVTFFKLLITNTFNKILEYSILLLPTLFRAHSLVLNIVKINHDLKYGHLHLKTPGQIALH